MTGTTAGYRECFLYVDATGVDEVTAELADHLGPPGPFRRFERDGFEIDVVKNGLRLRENPDDFIEWTTKVEVSAESAPDADVVRFVTALMGFLRSRGHRVVAACDFEDELPQTDRRPEREPRPGEP